MRTVALAAACGAEGVHPRADRVGRPMVGTCRKRGLAVYPWTVDAVADLNHLLRLGVNGVFTNDPRRLVRHLGQGRLAAGSR